MKKFEVGKKYNHGWIGDSNLTTTWEVIGRTACMITITDGREVKKCRIIKALSEMRNAESVFPYGQYSMAPVLDAAGVA